MPKSIRKHLLKAVLRLRGKSRSNRKKDKTRIDEQQTTVEEVAEIIKSDRKTTSSTQDSHKETDDVIQQRPVLTKERAVSPTTSDQRFVESLEQEQDLPWVYGLWMTAASAVDDLGPQGAQDSAAENTSEILSSLTVPGVDTEDLTFKALLEDGGESLYGLRDLGYPREPTIVYDYMRREDPADQHPDVPGDGDLDDGNTNAGDVNSAIGLFQLMRPEIRERSAGRLSDSPGGLKPTGYEGGMAADANASKEICSDAADDQIERARFFAAAHSKLRVAGQNSKTTIFSLPNELLLNIGGRTDSLRSLNALRQSSRRMHGLFQSMLYKRVLQDERDAASVQIWAAIQDRQVVIENLVSYGAVVPPRAPEDLGKKNSRKGTAFHYAAMFGHAKLLSYLIKSAGRDHASMLDEELSKPLDYACQYGHAEVVRVLLEEGKVFLWWRFHALSVYSSLPLESVLENGHLDVLRVMFEHRVKDRIRLYYHDRELALSQKERKTIQKALCKVIEWHRKKLKIEGEVVDNMLRGTVVAGTESMETIVPKVGPSFVLR